MPDTVQVVTAIVLLLAIGWRSRRRLPAAVIFGAIAAWVTRWYLGTLANEPVPAALWVWVGLTAVAAAMLVVGWRGPAGDAAPPPWSQFHSVRFARRWGSTSGSATSRPCRPRGIS
ncbi:hypothetical protein I551_2602 [Mycobacterium ulcerans str. Harvey]|uniref:Uncharacterized protein n=1 Tax=Mycobacterium ulcerans str. Harvey TaxID=1299332 RepID=A0ABN0R1M2_MYCUL|nr:hypothetical protein I551_2602 [Mycobacterium ulcerans str. Harvey]